MKRMIFLVGLFVILASSSANATEEYQWAIHCINGGEQSTWGQHEDLSTESFFNSGDNVACDEVCLWLKGPGANSISDTYARRYYRDLDVVNGSWTTLSSYGGYDYSAYYGNGWYYYCWDETWTDNYWVTYFNTDTHEARKTTIRIKDRDGSYHYYTAVPTGYW